MKNILIKGDKLISPLRCFAGHIASPLFDLSLRLYMGWAFFKSGLGRFRDFINGTWDTQLFLFEYEHPVPYLSSGFAAPITMIAELILPVLLVFGLFGRAAAAGLLIMTIVIEFTYNHNPDILIRPDHLVWATMLAIILIKGPGLISADHVLLKWLRADDNAQDGCCAKKI